MAILLGLILLFVGWIWWRILTDDPVTSPPLLYWVFPFVFAGAGLGFIVFA